MAEFRLRTASIRITSESGKVVCSVGNVLPTVEAEKAAGFVNAIETIYNDGPCDSRMNVSYDIISS